MLTDLFYIGNFGINDPLLMWAAWSSLIFFAGPALASTALYLRDEMREREAGNLKGRRPLHLLRPIPISTDTEERTKRRAA